MLKIINTLMIFLQGPLKKPQDQSQACQLVSPVDGVVSQAGKIKSLR